MTSLARLRSYLLLTLVTGVLAAWAGAGDSSRVLDSFALLSDAETDSSGTITADTLAAPANLTATANGITSINLTWTASADSYATGYRLFRRTNPGSYGSGTALTESQTSCVTPGDTSCAFSDTSLTGATTYCYKVQATYLNWSSPLSDESCATTDTPVELRDLFLSSPGANTNTDCDAATRSLVTSGASGACRISAVTKPPFEMGTWCTAGSVTVTAQANWVLTLSLDTGNPFQSATLLAEVRLNGTTIATSSVFTILPESGTVTVTLTPQAITTPVTGTLCLRITNQTTDSNPDSGQSHAAKVLTAGVSKIRGPWDP